MAMIADASTIKKLKSLVASKDAQVEALNGRIEVLMDDLVEARAERDHIRTTCFRLEDVVRQCQQEAEELEERATAAEERAAAAEAALVDNERDIAARRRSGSPTLDADALRRHNAQLEAELDVLRDRLIVQTEAELNALPAPRIAAAAHLVAPPAAAPPPRRRARHTLKATRPSRAAADAPPVAELPARLQGSPEERERWSQEVSRATGAVAPAAYVVPPLISAAKPEPAPAPAPAAASRPRSSSPRAQPGRSVYASTHASRTAAAAAAAATREEEVRRQLAVMTAARERALAAVAAL